MGRLSACLGACLVLALSCGASAQERQSPGPRPKPNARDLGVPPVIEIPASLKERLASFAEFKKTLVRPPVECVAGAGGVCPTIWIQIVTAKDANGNVFCGGLIAEKVVFNGTPSNDKTLIWALIPDPQNPTAQIRFHKDHGILVLSDDQKQLKNLKLGDGSSGAADPMRFSATNKHKSKQTAVYVPVILSTDAAGKISICATPDPLIVNN